MLVMNEENATTYFTNSTSKSDTSIGEEWNTLWKVKVQPKIHVFLWRLARQTLPTSDVRCHRNMAPNSLCAMCGGRDSWRHSLLDIAELVSIIPEQDAQGWLSAIVGHAKNL